MKQRRIEALQCTKLFGGLTSEVLSDIAERTTDCTFGEARCCFCPESRRRACL